jgi:cysteine synthase
MSPIAAAIVTGFGLLLALAGVGCGIAAYVASVRQHDTMPVWPWASRMITHARQRLTFKRDVRAGSGTATISLAGSAIGSGEAFGTLSVARSNETVDERIGRLEARVQLVEERAGAEQARAEKAERLLEEQMNRQGRLMEEADEQLRELAKAVAIGSARLQLVGLILVGVGTMLMAVPTIAAAF